eukprot:Protomagalhaensia_wolfi_Nauph_80__5555@NODE_612_length_2210_cov_1817_290649_g459_i0_p1_GENE_NODE_612_length_2210_cov_1817_290649_g459_i0NODE_612_length_2210_cov_1817_290649_g459_i0_p1_ORF_typecomplete_len194_score33_52Ecm33/PF12454_8/0_37Ecm33/PF12454_8/3_6e02_NODE_612_length_2210_cov_1817_290649_g459_i0184765
MIGILPALLGALAVQAQQATITIARQGCEGDAVQMCQSVSNPTVLDNNMMVTLVTCLALANNLPACSVTANIVQSTQFTGNTPLQLTHDLLISNQDNIAEHNPTISVVSTTTSQGCTLETGYTANGACQILSGSTVPALILGNVCVDYPVSACPTTGSLTVTTTLTRINESSGAPQAVVMTILASLLMMVGLY